MSANNYLTINRKFEVEMRDAEEGDLHSIVGKGETIEQALEIAMQNMDDVEYGLRHVEGPKGAQFACLCVKDCKCDHCKRKHEAK
jgi:hypothetical protein